MKGKFFHHRLFLVLIGLCLSIPQVLAASFGLAPPSISNSSLKPGSDFVYVVDLNTNDPSEDRAVEALIQGDDEVKNWVKIQNRQLIMPKGEAHVPMNIRVRVPDDAKAGRYRGRIALSVSPKNKSSNAVALRLGGNISIDLKVTQDNILDYKVKSVSVGEIKIGDPLLLRFKVENLGNQPVKTIETKLDIFDIETEERILTKRASQLSASIDPHVTGNAEMNMVVPQLKPGRFKGNLTSYKDGEVIYENEYSIIVRDHEGQQKKLLKSSKDDGQMAAPEKAVSLKEFFSHPLPISILFLLILIVAILALKGKKKS